MWAITSAVFLLSFAWIFLSRVPSAEAAGGASVSSPRVGFVAPDFTLDLLGGEKITLSDLRGKVVLVNIWASWCPPCLREMPALEEVYQEFKDQGLVVLAVNTTYQDSEAQAAEFAQNFGLTFPIPLDRTGAVSKRYLLRGLPSTYFVDRQGIIRSVVIGGPMNKAVITSNVQNLID